jgi:hypothetical protein
VANKTVAQLLADLPTEIKNSGNTNVNKALRLSLVRALSRLSSYKTLFTENTFTFTAVAGQAEYGSAVSGFPKDAASFDVVEFFNGTEQVEIKQEPIELVLGVLRNGVVSPDGRYPFCFAWHKQQLVIAPAPPTATAVRGWYHRDARRDTATGNLIDATASSDTYTNDWFGDGEDALWAKVLQIYHLSFAIDPDRAAFYGSEFRDAVGALVAQFERKTMAGFQAEWAGL